MSCRLNGIGVKQHSALAAELSYLRYRQYRAYLVVCVHNADKACVGTNRVFHLLGGDGSGSADRQKLNVKSFFF